VTNGWNLLDGGSECAFLLGWLAESVTDRPYADLVAEEIWQLIGAESDADIAVGPTGAAAVHAGLSLRLRDLVRFGLLFTPSARDDNNDSLVSSTMIEGIHNNGRSDDFVGDIGGFVLDNLGGERPVSFTSRQWDFVTEEGDFFKGGWGGQGLYVSPQRDLVIAYFGTPDDEGAWNELMRISRMLAKSGLFDT
jgi:CubicO group peptidase (beta-lactamase class C family)